MKRSLTALGKVSLVLLVVVFAASTANRGPATRQAIRWQAGDVIDAALGNHPGEPEKPEELKAWYDWFYGQRAAPGRHIPGAARAAAAKQMLAMRTNSKTLVAGTLWTELGPKPIDSANFTYNDPQQGTPPLGWHDVSGRVASMVVKPDDPNTVYMGAADGGVWRSHDAGQNWEPIGDHLDTLSIGALAVDPKHPEDLYVGTGEATSAFENYWGTGVYYSADGGDSFTKLNDTPFQRLCISRIRVSRAGDILVATNQGLFKSTDHGATWDRTLAPGIAAGDSGGSWISDVSYLPGTRDQQVLAAVGWRNGSSFNGFYLSSDGGDTWTRLAGNGLPNTPHFGRTTFDVSQSDPNLIWAVIEDPKKLLTGSATVLNGVYKTMGGPTGHWELKATSQKFARDEGSSLNPDHLTGYPPGVQAWYNQYVYINPFDSNNVIVGLEEIYNTDNGGDDWYTIGRYWNFCQDHVFDPPACFVDPAEHPTTHPDQHAAAFTSRNGQAFLYVGNDGGVWSQPRDPVFNNDDWTDLNATLATAQFYYAEPSSDATFTVYGGLQDNGSLKYTGSQKWPMVISGDGGDVGVEPNNPNHTYEEYVYLLMSKSKDGGRNWVPIPTPDSGNPGAARFIAPFDLDPTNPNRIIALGQHVWVSRKGVDTHSEDWRSIYNNGAGRVGTALSVRGPTIYEGWCQLGCNPAAIDGSDPAPFLRGLASNVGGAWHELAANGLPNRYVSGIYQDPNNASHVFVTLSGYSRKWIPAAGYGHVFESFDGGENFTDISANLPDIPANDVVFVHQRLIVATDVGVFERHGTVWSVLGPNLPTVSVLDLAFAPGSSTLTAATHGRGVWTIALS